jgi:hypothetical protein
MSFEKSIQDGGRSQDVRLLRKTADATGSNKEWVIPGNVADLPVLYSVAQQAALGAREAMMKKG